MAEGSLKESNDSALKSQATDQQVVKMVGDRSMKAEAPEAFKPIKSPYHFLGDPPCAFNADRNKLIEYISSADDDMRVHRVHLKLSQFNKGSPTFYKAYLV